MPPPPLYSPPPPPPSDYHQDSGGKPFSTTSVTRKQSERSSELGAGRASERAREPSLTQKGVDRLCLSLCACMPVRARVCPPPLLFSWSPFFLLFFFLLPIIVPLPLPSPSLSLYRLPRYRPHLDRGIHRNLNRQKLYHDRKAWRGTPPSTTPALRPADRPSSSIPRRDGDVRKQGAPADAGVSPARSPNSILDTFSLLSGNFWHFWTFDRQAGRHTEGRTG